MGKKLGNDYRLWVETAVAATYAIVKGQQSLQQSRAANTIDTSTKDDAPYATTAAGLFDYGITLNGIADLPDATGFTFVEGKFKSQTPWKFQIRKGGSGGVTGDAVFEGLCNILDMSVDYGQNEAVKYTLKIAPATAPTIDLIA